jgi:hypothetical protein
VETTKEHSGRADRGVRGDPFWRAKVRIEASEAPSPVGNRAGLALPFLKSAEMSA